MSLISFAPKPALLLCNMGLFCLLAALYHKGFHNPHQDKNIVKLFRNIAYQTAITNSTLLPSKSSVQQYLRHRAERGYMYEDHYEEMEELMKNMISLEKQLNLVKDSIGTKRSDPSIADDDTVSFYRQEGLLPTNNPIAYTDSIVNVLQSILHDYRCLVATKHKTPLPEYTDEHYRQIIQFGSLAEINIFLVSIENNLAIIESEVLNQLKLEADANHILSFDRFGIDTESNTTTLHQGDSLETHIGFRTLSSDKRVKVMVGKKTLPINEHGYAEYALPCPKTGKFTLNGKIGILLHSRDSSEYLYMPFTTEYEVMARCD